MELVYPRERTLFKVALTLSIVVWVLIVAATFGVALLYVGLFFLFALFVQAGFISRLKGSGVLVTPEQYPDLHAKLIAACKTVGLAEVPEMYLLRTDFFNALATRFLRRHYIVLFTDVVDALAERPDAISFYIGHELGHIQRNHIRWGWILLPVLWLPVLGSAYRRAEEYTCDRYGNACCPGEEDATAAMAAIVAGNTRWKSINVPAYLEQVQGTGGFWMSLNELISDYPWLSKRMAWVVAMRRGTTPTFPRRHSFAWFLSLFVPSVPGGFGTMVIAIAFFGILAAVALPAYQDYVRNAELARQASDGAESAEFSQQLTPENLQLVLQEFEQIKGQVAEYHANQGAWPTDFTQLGWQSSTLRSDWGGMPVRIYDDGAVAVWYGDNAQGPMYFGVYPVVDDGGAVQWACFGQNIAEDYLPAECR